MLHGTIRHGYSSLDSTEFSSVFLRVPLACKRLLLIAGPHPPTAPDTSSKARATCLMPSWGVTDFSRAAGLPECDEETAQKCIQPLELAQVIVDICLLPPHLTVQELILWPLVQQVEPL